MAEDRPYKQLGDQIKRLRENRYESLPEVSGALEIDSETLAKIERGLVKPSEETLLMLFAHFGASEDEAGKLWRQAGYTTDKAQFSNGPVDTEDSKPMVMVVTDPRIVYTDVAQVTVNNHGVVMNFMQSGASGQPPMAVSKVGMSREHAHSLLKLLAQSLILNKTVAKQLPEPKKLKEK